MGKEHPRLSALNFLLEITKNSLLFYSENNVETEIDKCSFELTLNSGEFDLLLDKLENYQEIFSDDPIIMSYIVFRIHEIKRAKEGNTVSAYQNNPKYGIQYFSLIHEVLTEKKKQLARKEFMSFA
jgi:hypothetical protein